MTDLLIYKAIYNLNPKARFWVKGELTFDHFDRLTWAPDHQGIKPTAQEVQAEYERLVVEKPKHDLDVKRRNAYAVESDPLFFKWQAGEGTKEEWEAKRAEIRARYPAP